MTELLCALALILCFTLSALAGRAMRKRLPEAHRALETLDYVQLSMSLLVTFSAVVLGLLTTSVKTSFDAALHDRVQYAEQLTELDLCLRNYGSETAPIRDSLRRYVGGVIASTWPDEPRPVEAGLPDTSSMARVGPDPVLGKIMNGIGVAIRDLGEANPGRRVRADDCWAGYRDVRASRAAVLEDLDLGMSKPFFLTVVFWLMAVFAGFGMRAPGNATAGVVTVLGILAVTSALALILDLNSPYRGTFRIPSDAMRAALAAMLKT